MNKSLQFFKAIQRKNFSSLDQYYLVNFKRLQSSFLHRQKYETKHDNKQQCSSFLFYCCINLIWPPTAGQRRTRATRRKRSISLRGSIQILPTSCYRVVRELLLIIHRDDVKPIQRKMDCVDAVNVLYSLFIVVLLQLAYFCIHTKY